MIIIYINLTYLHIEDNNYMEVTMRLGIFGGSFNPPHNMHKKIALNLINNCYLDKVIYVPTGDKYKKDGLVSSIDRYNMVKIMIKNNPNLFVSDYELKNNLTYTYQTLDYFKNKYSNDDIYFICGTDNLKQIETWKNYEYILMNYKLLIIKRNCKDLNKIIEKFSYKNIILTDIPLNDASPTHIRTKLKQNINTIDGQIDKNVLKYIKNKNLYIKG